MGRENAEPAVDRQDRQRRYPPPWGVFIKLLYCIAL